MGRLSGDKARIQEQREQASHGLVYIHVLAAKRETVAMPSIRTYCNIPNFYPSKASIAELREQS